MDDLGEGVRCLADVELSSAKIERCECKKLCVYYQ